MKELDIETFVRETDGRVQRVWDRVWMVVQYHSSVELEMVVNICRSAKSSFDHTSPASSIPWMESKRKFNQKSNGCDVVSS